MGRSPLILAAVMLASPNIGCLPALPPLEVDGSVIGVDIGPTVDSAAPDPDDGVPPPPDPDDGVSPPPEPDDGVAPPPDPDDGVSPPPDDGPPGCVPAPETLDETDEDCDGRVDEEVETAGGIRCAGVEVGPPCNGCPDGSVVPEGWVCAPAGEFAMGISEAQRAAHRINTRDWEVPQRTVRFERPLLVKQHEVTRGEWAAYFPSRPSDLFYEPCDRCPIDHITWYDALAYANALSEALDLDPCFRLEACISSPGVSQPQNNETGYECNVQLDWAAIRQCDGVRPPTEAEWEYFARAGTETLFWSGDAVDGLLRVDWVRGLDAEQPQRVGLRQPNPWGVHDVHGNVAEWVLDGFSRSIYGDRAAALGGAADPDPLADDLGPTSENERMIRGCYANYGSAEERCGSGARHWHFDSLDDHRTGIRLVRPLPAP